MSTLMEKHILVVGDETSQVHNLESLLLTEGMTIHVTSCDSVTEDKIEHEKIDIVLLNHLHEGNACINMLSHLRKNRLHKVLPIIALVENTPVHINEALALGAADYITTDEPLESVVQKMKTILGDPDNFANSNFLNLDSTQVPTKAGGSERVFVVEDDPLLRNLISLRLEKTGFIFELNPGDPDVISAIVAFAPDVLILDLMLPGQDGFSILEILRTHENESIKTLPVIVFSNKDSQTDRQRAINLGVSGYYVKAMTDLAELMQTINSIVSK